MHAVLQPLEVNSPGVKLRRFHTSGGGALSEVFILNNAYPLK